MSHSSNLEVQDITPVSWQGIGSNTAHTPSHGSKAVAEETSCSLACATSTLDRLLQLETFHGMPYKSTIGPAPLADIKKQPNTNKGRSTPKPAVQQEPGECTTGLHGVQMKESGTRAAFVSLISGSCCYTETACIHHIPTCQANPTEQKQCKFVYIKFPLATANPTEQQCKIVDASRTKHFSVRGGKNLQAKPFLHDTTSCCSDSSPHNKKATLYHQNHQNVWISQP